MKNGILYRAAAVFAAGLDNDSEFFNRLGWFKGTALVVIVVII